MVSRRSPITFWERKVPQKCWSRGRRIIISAKPALECLERRWMLSTYTVNTLSDAPNPGAGLLTLRQAVSDVNANRGSNIINFDSTVFPTNRSSVITLAQGELLITQTGGATVIAGPGEAALTLDAHSASRDLEVGPGVNISLSGLTLINGSAPTGGALLSAGTLTLSNCGVTQSVAQSDGGGIYSTGNLNVTGSTIANNQAKATTAGVGAAGGGIYSAGAAVISSTTFASNSALDPVATMGSAAGGAAAGGAVYAGSSLSLTQDKFTANSVSGGSSQQGIGGLALGGAIDAVNGLSATQITVSSNTATGGASAAGQPANATGGGIAFLKTANISSSTLSGNIANGGRNSEASADGPGLGMGGGIFGGQASTLTLNTSVVSGNRAITFGNYSTGGAQGSAYAEGGGIFGATTTISGSTLSSNIAQGGNGYENSPHKGGPGGDARGGGVASASALSITLSTVTGNQAIGGSGYAYGGAGGRALGAGVCANTSTTISQSTISDNLATGGSSGKGGKNSTGETFSPGPAGSALGAGIYLAQSVLHLVQSTVSGNTGAGRRRAAGKRIDQLRR